MIASRHYVRMHRYVLTPTHIYLTTCIKIFSLFLIALYYMAAHIQQNARSNRGLTKGGRGVRV